jgi:hypothetical protein
MISLARARAKLPPPQRVDPDLGAATVEETHMDAVAILNALKDDMYGRYHELPSDKRDEWIRTLTLAIGRLIPPQEPADGQGTS